MSRLFSFPRIHAVIHIDSTSDTPLILIDTSGKLIGFQLVTKGR